jgi:hypothetical protein
MFRVASLLRGRLGLLVRNPLVAAGRRIEPLRSVTAGAWRWQHTATPTTASDAPTTASAEEVVESTGAVEDAGAVEGNGAMEGRGSIEGGETRESVSLEGEAAKLINSQKKRGRKFVMQNFYDLLPGYEQGKTNRVLSDSTLSDRGRRGGRAGI